MFRCL